MSDNVETVDIDASVSCSISAVITPECPITDETDVYEVTVRWDTDGQTLEKWSLIEWLHTFGGREVTQEQLAAQVKDGLRGDGITGLNIEVIDIKDTGLEVVA